MKQPYAKTIGRIRRHAPQTYAAYSSFMDEADLSELRFGKPAFKRLLAIIEAAEFAPEGESLWPVGLILEFATHELSARRWLRKTVETWTPDDQRKYRKLVRKGKELARWAWAQDRIGFGIEYICHPMFDALVAAFLVALASLARQR